MNYLLGAELNGNQLKIVALKKVGNTYEIVIIDKLNIIGGGADAVNKLIMWKDQKIPEATSVKVVLTVSESVLYIKEIEFPKIQKEKLREAVYWEIPSVSPIPQADAIYDWQIISEEKDSIKVLVIVGKNTHTESVISMFRGAQMEVVAIEPSSYAFARVANAPFSYNTLVCLVQEYGMDFIILKKGVPFFTTSTSGNTQREKLSTIKSGTDLITEVVAESQKIIKYWETKGADKIQQILFAGDLVYKYFGYSASINPFPPIPSYICQVKKPKSIVAGTYKDLDLASYIISLGAATRHLQKNVLEGINLIPPVEKEKSEKLELQKKLSKRVLNYVYANLVILTVLIVSIFALNFWWYSLEKELGRLNDSMLTHPANSLITEVHDTNRISANVVTLTKQQQDFGAKLRAISEYAPQTVDVVSVNLVNSKSQDWTIQGTGDTDSILAFYKMITQSLPQAQVDMPYSNFNTNDINEFSISIKW